MCFYIFKCAIIIFVIEATLYYDVGADINVIDQGVLPLHKGSVAILLYVDIENRSARKACRVSSWTKNCCLASKEASDCDTVEAFGGDMGFVGPREQLTMLYIYPTVYQHDKIGFCDVVMEHNCGGKYDASETKIMFDTNVYEKRKKRANKGFFKYYCRPEQVKYCESVDLNPLDNCAPVNCDWKYNGYRPFYDKNRLECVRALPCVQDETENLPNIVYVPKANKCRDVSHPISLEDIYAITSGVGITKAKFVTEMPASINLVQNLTTISQNLKFLKDMMYGKVQKEYGAKYDYSANTRAAILAIFFYVAFITALVLGFVCCLNASLFTYNKYLHRKKADHNKYWDTLTRFKGDPMKPTKSRVRKDVKESLLRDVIARDIPMELRHSVVDISESRESHTGERKQHLYDDLGSQITLEDIIRDIETSTTSISSCEYYEEDVQSIP